MITHIFFDLDDTLLDFHKAEHIALSKTFSHFGIKPTEEILNLYSQINKAQWERLEKGELTRSEVKTERYRILFNELGVTLSPKDTTAYYENMLSFGHYFVDGAIETLNQLKDYSLFIVSNGAVKVQNKRLDSAGIKPFFKKIFISESLGVNKPDKQFFDICFSEIPSFNKENAVIIGDSLTSDIKGGINAGIKTVWFNPHSSKNSSTIFPDHEINTLAEFPDLIKKI